MWALADDAENCRVAGCLCLELATLLGGHGVRVGMGWGSGQGGGEVQAQSSLLGWERVGGGGEEKGTREEGLINIGTAPGRVSLRRGQKHSHISG